MKFTPANLVVTAGTTVTWNWLDGPHSVTSGVPGTPDGLFDSGAPQSAGASFTHAFPTAGTYHYYCTVHGAMMTGTVTVN
jgi:plastocyanin